MKPLTHEQRRMAAKEPGTEAIKAFFILNSAEYELFDARKFQITYNAKFRLAKHSWVWKFLC